MRSKIAYPTVTGTIGGSGGNFYSPELSTDFLELPQSIDEQRNYYRHWYAAHPFVGQAIDLHTELPLSKIRLGSPKAKSKELAARSLDFCEKWCKRIGTLHRLLEIVHDYHLLGEVFVFAEDNNPDMPEDVRSELIREVNDDGVVEKWVERKDANEREVAWLQRNYKGWTAIRVLPPEQIHMEAFPFTDERIIELIPDSKTKDIVSKAGMGDPNAERITNSMPATVVDAITQGQNIPLNTDPDAGSFVFYMARKKSQYEPRGHSILERCLRALVFEDHVRQSQASIAQRHMTPMRVVWAADMDVRDVEDLREQIDMSLADPDYSIITNFELNWQEMGAENRLPDWTNVFERVDRLLYAGLGVTESLLSGESSYSGDRLNLEVVNTRYLLLREIIQEMVEEHFFKPMCRRMGFVEEDEYGDLNVIYPSVSFTRLGLRDNQETFEHLFALYQKGSVDVGTILELLNLDPDLVKKRLMADMWSVNDATFNELVRGVLTAAAEKIMSNTDVVRIIAEKLELKYEPPKEGDGRF